MATCCIEMLGNSPASFHGDVQLGDYLFNSLDGEENIFSVVRFLEADSWRPALGIFNIELWPLLDAVAFHRLSAVSSYGVSTVITKNGSNVALAMLTKRSPGVGLSLYGSEHNENRLAEIMRLAQAKDPVLGHFRSSMLATGANAVTFHLLQCVESMAGAVPQSVRCENCKNTLKCAGCEVKHRPVMTSHPRLEEILGNDLYQFYYRKQGSNLKSYRNMLAHGDYVEETELSSKVVALYEAIKNAVKAKYNIKDMPGVVGVRTMYGYGAYDLFIEYDAPLPPLPQLLKMVDDGELRHDSAPYRIIFDDRVTLDDF